jgi:hypothetical protein
VERKKREGRFDREIEGERERETETERQRGDEKKHIR